MAIKIPDAPNVIGTQPVMREVDSINPKFERPNFKIDVSQPVQAVKDTGKAYASYVDYNTNIWMGAACNQFSHDILEEENRLKSTHKGLAANDLYAKLEKYATGVLDDMTGEPKDDGRVRIANPELRKRFRDWASQQMPAYQSRMMNYSASELDTANKQIIKQGIEDNNNFVLKSSYQTADLELDAAWPNYIRAAQLSAPGMPKEYQMAEAARMMDEAVYAKMKMLADTNVLEGLSWYHNVPAVQKAMSSKSSAAFFADIEKNYIDQGGADVATDLASGGSGARPGGYLDMNTIAHAFPNSTEAERAAIYTKVYDKGREINDAREKAIQGMAEQQKASVQGRVVATNILSQEDVEATYREYMNVDPVGAEQWHNEVQEHLANIKAIEDYDKAFPNGDPREDLLEEGFDEAALEAEYDDLLFTYRQSKNYDSFSGTKVGWFDTRVPAKKQIDEDFNKAFGTKQEYIQRRKDAYLFGSDMSPLTHQEIDDITYGKPLTRTNKITSDTMFRPVATPALTPEQIDLIERRDRIIDKTSSWINSPVYAEYVAKASAGEYHGEDVPELRGMPLDLRNNLRQIVYYNNRYNEVIRQNAHIDEDLKSRVKDYNKKSNQYLSNMKRETVKAFDDYRQHVGAYPLKGSIEYNTILNTAVASAESPSKYLTERYLSSEAADHLQKKKLNPYLNPEASIEEMDDVDLLSLRMKVSQKIKKDTDAETWADAIIDATPRTKRNRVRPYRDAIIQGIEKTGNADVWYEYIDGIGK